MNKWTSVFLALLLINAIGIVWLLVLPVHEQPGGITEQQYQQTREQIRQQLIGLWQDDSNDGIHRDFNDDGTVITSYFEGEGVFGTWDFVYDASKEPVQLPAVAGITVLKITTDMDGARYYVIQDVSNMKLNLMDVQSGQEYSYTSIRFIKHQSQDECEQKLGRTCSIMMCDVVPEGKTYEEVCGPGPSPWWAPLQ